MNAPNDGMTVRPLATRLLAAGSQALQGMAPLQHCGRVVEARGTLLRVAGVQAGIGELCELRLTDGRCRVAEVVGLADEGALLMPHGDLVGITLGTQVFAAGHGHCIDVGEALLGRVLGGFGQPIDERGPVAGAHRVAVHAPAPHPLRRRGVQRSLHTGVRAIDALLTLAEGQRIGVFAPAGVGKSTLAGMLLRQAEADVCVVALIGERGREVGEFVHHVLGAEGLRRSVVVAATSDSSAAERVNAGFVATAVAESFRDHGQRVLLVMDSVTRLARALREVGLAGGEPPTRRGYPASVFAVLPRLMERAGQGERGSITALYTVLVEGEDDEDPIAEEVRSVLDGHIVLSRKLARRPLYPAIDILASLSRTMDAVVDDEHREAARRLRALLARHDEIELLIQLGEYRTGSDALADEAIAKIERIRAFLAQSRADSVPEGSARQALLDLMR